MLGKAFLQPLSSQGGSLSCRLGCIFLSPAASAIWKTTRAQDIERYPGIVLRMLGKAFLQRLSSQGRRLSCHWGCIFLSPAALAARKTTRAVSIQSYAPRKTGKMLLRRAARYGLCFKTTWFKPFHPAHPAGKSWMCA